MYQMQVVSDTITDKSWSYTTWEKGKWMLKLTQLLDQSPKNRRGLGLTVSQICELFFLLLDFAQLSLVPQHKGNDVSHGSTNFF